MRSRLLVALVVVVCQCLADRVDADATPAPIPDCDSAACSPSVGKSMGCGAAGKSYWNKYNSAQQRRDKTTSFYGCQGFADGTTSAAAGAANT